MIIPSEPIVTCNNHHFIFKVFTKAIFKGSLLEFAGSGHQHWFLNSGIDLFVVVYSQNLKTCDDIFSSPI